MTIKNKYGYLTYNKIGSNEYCINNLYIKPCYRHKGRATRLLKQIIDRLHGSIIWIVCSGYKTDYDILKRFYIKHGFKVITEGKTECLMKKL